MNNRTDHPGQWISVKDALPPAMTDVAFVATFNGQPELCFGYKKYDDPEDNLWYDRLSIDQDGDFYDVYNVTHWLPLPPIPTE